jgi:hypothetical protein
MEFNAEIVKRWLCKCKDEEENNDETYIIPVCSANTDGVSIRTMTVSMGLPLSSAILTNLSVRPIYYPPTEV